MTVRLGRIYHPSHRTPDLEPIERFFREVFGRHSLSRSSLIMAGLVKQAPEYPEDYCTFTPVADLFFDSIVPEKYVWDGKQPYASVSQPYLDGYGWAVDEGMQQIWDACQASGIRLTDQWNNVVEGPVMATASFKPTPLFWTLEDDTGLRYEFYPTDSITNYDHRSVPGWTLPPVSDLDPVSIIRTSHHTVLTNDMPRATKFFVDILGGEILDERENPVWNTRSTFIRIADDVHELAVPIKAGSPAGEALAKRSPLDTYYSIGFHVADLDKVVRTLERNKVGTIYRSDTAVVTDPATAIGIPWGFYADLPFATT
jgi:catechol 2,3-dioxygenase-like lactoylglutathione lyase family enzyme